MSGIRLHKMRSWSWREGLAFAFASKLLSAEKSHQPYEMSVGEKWGTRLLQPLYRVIEFVSKNVKMPLAICFFTLLAALLIGFAFYTIPAFVIFGRLFPVWLIRALFFVYVEINLLAMGCVAFGRFNNKELVSLWKNGCLVAVMPGDYELRN